MTSHRHRAARAGTNQIMDLSHWLASPNSHILIGCKSCRWNRIELLGCAARTLCRDAFRERSVLQGKPKCSTHRNIELLYPYSQRFIGGDILGISEHWGGLVPPNVYGRYAYGRWWESLKEEIKELSIGYSRGRNMIQRERERG